MHGKKPPELDTDDNVDGDPLESPMSSPSHKTAFDDERLFWQRYLMLQNGTATVAAAAKKNCDE